MMFAFLAAVVADILAIHPVHSLVRTFPRDTDLKLSLAPAAEAGLISFNRH